MNRTLTLALVLGCSFTATAQLAPHRSAPLADHLVEVNAQWAAQPVEQLLSIEEAHFTSDTERIAKHLHLVRERLLARTPEGLSAGQQSARRKALDDLHRYAERGRFPQNHVLPYRNPVFIDPHGTACAVGQLMIESGHEELAVRIQREMNLAYVLDMPLPEVASWASEHGFTPEELAWIQPGYSPPILPFVPMGGGTNGAVSVVHALGNGDLIVAGDFTEAGGVAAQRIARWNGSAYSALGAGLQGEVTCMVSLGTDVYVGGSMLNGPADLARWDGNTWTFSTVFDGKSPRINALHVHNNMLYAAGEQVGFAGVIDLVMRMNGSAWEPVGSPLNATIHALATHNGGVVAAGAFTNLMSTGTPVIAHIAELEGNEWGQLADGLDATVRTLLSVNGTLYAAGDVVVNVLPTFGMARLAAGGPTWELLMPNGVNYIGGIGPAYINTMAEFGGTIFFGGLFSIYQGMVYGTNLGVVNGVDLVAAVANLDAPVNALLIEGNRMVMGGDFTMNTGQLLNHVAALDLTTAVRDMAPPADLRVFPNPAVEQVTIQWPGADLSSAAAGVIDAQGKAVPVRIDRTGDRLLLHIGALPSGAYTVRVAVGDASWSTRFVKQ